MKSAIFSLFLISALIYSSAHLSTAAPPCGTVDTKAAACLTFATGKSAKPSAACCSGLQQLARGVKTVDDKKAICRCLKAGVKNFNGVQDRYLTQIPAACKIRVSFPVSINTDCEKLR